jgi:hypothetical protein
MLQRILLAVILVTVLLASCTSIPAGTAPPPPPPQPTEIPPTEAPTLEPTAEVQEVTLYVDSHNVECVGVAPQLCLRVRQTPEGEWENFYDSIEGFTYEETFFYTLRLAVTQVENPPADGSALRYQLLEVVTVEPEPISVRIDTPTFQEAVTSPITVTGFGRGLFEGAVVVQVQSLDGEVLAQEALILTGEEVGTGGEGTFIVTFDLALDPGTEVVIVAYADSPRDGSVVTEDRVRVIVQ